MSREQHNGDIRDISTDRLAKKINQPIDVLNQMKNELQEEKRKYIRALEDYKLMSEKDQKLVHDLANKGISIKEAINSVLTQEEQSYRYED
ncbi:MAG: hypothetical protein AB4372_28665 [Xenococcus sp. (in: cyanobacteria)]